MIISIEFLPALPNNSQKSKDKSPTMQIKRLRSSLRNLKLKPGTVQLEGKWEGELSLPAFLKQNKIMTEDKLQRETLLTTFPLYALRLLILNAIPGMCKELKSKFHWRKPFPRPNLLHLWRPKASSILRL